MSAHGTIYRPHIHFGEGRHKNTNKNRKTSIFSLCLYLCRFGEVLDSAEQFNMDKVPQLEDNNNALERGKTSLFSNEKGGLFEP